MAKKRETGTAGSVDFYWSYRSHYCYLGLDRVRELERDYDVVVTLRPVYPIAIRTPEFFANMPRNPKRWQYIMRDAERLAQMLNLPFGWPDPDPVVMNMETLEIAAEQPYIHRLTCLGAAACRRGAGLEFTTAVARLIWGGKRGWDKGRHLAQAAKSAGLNLAEMDADIENRPNSYADDIRNNEEALAAAGHWGVPTLVFQNESFFGQDRIDVCRWRLDQQGLRRK
jgi:2-hydroxychromene-2-carboxylate isomerase